MGAALKWCNVALRAIMEMGIVVALGYWGYQTGKSMTAKILLGMGAPVLGFGVWGAVDFRQAGTLAEPLRLFEELIISGLAAVAWYTAGRAWPRLGLGAAVTRSPCPGVPAWRNLVEA